MNWYKKSQKEYLRQTSLLYKQAGFMNWKAFLAVVAPSVVALLVGRFAFPPDKAEAAASSADTPVQLIEQVNQEAQSMGMESSQINKIDQAIKQVMQEKVTETKATENTNDGAKTNTSASKLGITEDQYNKAQKMFGDELPVIEKAALRNNCTGKKFTLLLAIRKAENGGPGLEFGVLHPKAKGTNLDTQAGWSAATIVKNYARWQKSGSKDTFIGFLSKVYCPIGADNDPNGLNEHWRGNVETVFDNLSS